MANWPDHLVDIGVLILILVSGGLAFFRGFVHEVLAVAGWVGAIFATWYGYSALSPYLVDIVGGNPTTANIAAGVILFVITLAVLSLVTRAVSRRVQESALNAVDRSLGFLFGVARGAIIVCLGWMLIGWIQADDMPGWLTNSRTAPLAEEGAKLLRSLAPNSEQAGKQAAGEAKDKLNRALDSGKLLERLVSPPPSDSGNGSNNGYNNDTRKQADELMKQAQ